MRGSPIRSSHLPSGDGGGIPSSYYSSPGIGATANLTSSSNSNLRLSSHASPSSSALQYHHPSSRAFSSSPPRMPRSISPRSFAAGVQQQPSGIGGAVAVAPSPSSSSSQLRNMSTSPVKQQQQQQQIYPHSQPPPSPMTLTSQQQRTPRGSTSNSNNSSSTTSGASLGLVLSGSGTAIANIVEGSIADADGRLQCGDVIVAVNGIKVSNTPAIYKAVCEAMGEVLIFTVERAPASNSKNKGKRDDTDSLGSSISSTNSSLLLGASIDEKTNVRLSMRGTIDLLEQKEKKNDDEGNGNGGQLEKEVVIGLGSGKTSISTAATTIAKSNGEESKSNGVVVVEDSDKSVTSSANSVASGISSRSIDQALSASMETSSADTIIVELRRVKKFAPSSASLPRRDQFLSAAEHQGEVVSFGLGLLIEISEISEMRNRWMSAAKTARADIKKLHETLKRLSKPEIEPPPPPSDLVSSSSSINSKASEEKQRIEELEAQNAELQKLVDAERKKRRQLKEKAEKQRQTLTKEKEQLGEEKKMLLTQLDEVLRTVERYKEKETQKAQIEKAHWEKEREALLQLEAEKEKEIVEWKEKLVAVMKERDEMARVWMEEKERIQKEKESIETDIAKAKTDIRKDSRQEIQSEIEKHRQTFSEHSQKLEATITQLQQKLREKSENENEMTEKIELLEEMEKKRMIDMHLANEKFEKDLNEWKDKAAGLEREKWSLTGRCEEQQKIIAGLMKSKSFSEADDATTIVSSPSLAHSPTRKSLSKSFSEADDATTTVSSPSLAHSPTRKSLANQEEFYKKLEEERNKRETIETENTKLRAELSAAQLDLRLIQAEENAKRNKAQVEAGFQEAIQQLSQQVEQSKHQIIADITNSLREELATIVHNV